MNIFQCRLLILRHNYTLLIFIQWRRREKIKRMRATCSTKRGDLRGGKKAVNPKYPNPLFSKNETMKGIQHHHSASTSLISKFEDIDQRSCIQYRTNIQYENLLTEEGQCKNADSNITSYSHGIDTNCPKSCDR